MRPRRAWVRAAVLLALLGLLVGRWAAVSVANGLWAESLGVEATHTAIAQLKLTLLALAFAVAATWSLGNLYLVYRTIGSVHVPRRLGNLEIDGEGQCEQREFELGDRGVRGLNPQRLRPESVRHADGGPATHQQPQERAKHGGPHPPPARPQRVPRH